MVSAAGRNCREHSNRARSHIDSVGFFATSSQTDYATLSATQTTYTTTIPQAPGTYYAHIAGNQPTFGPLYVWSAATLVTIPARIVPVKKGNTSTVIKARRRTYVADTKRLVRALASCSTLACSFRQVKAFAGKQLSFDKVVGKDVVLPAPCGSAARALRSRLPESEASTAALQRAIAAGLGVATLNPALAPPDCKRAAQSAPQAYTSQPAAETRATPSGRRVRACCPHAECIRRLLAARPPDHNLTHLGHNGPCSAWLSDVRCAQFRSITLVLEPRRTTPKRRRTAAHRAPARMLTYQSQIMFDPDIVVEIFVFDRAGDFEQRLATAQGQIDQDAAGEVSGDEA